MQEYLKLLQHVRDNGVQRGDRTGTGTLSVFGWQSRYDLQAGFPAVTTKRLAFKTMAHELLWFLRGDPNLRYLHENNVRIWDEWASPEGDLGPVYGVQWRRWQTENGPVDQIAQLVERLKRDPYSRRHVVSAWNVGGLEDMALLPCHVLFQFYVAKGRLSCHLYQRSGDLFLGVPFNIASYALFTHMLAQVVGLQVGDLVHTLGDAHLYLNHLDQVEEQLSRMPLPLPTLWLDPSISNIDDFRIEHMRLDNYQHHPSIKAPIAV